MLDSKQFSFANYLRRKTEEFTQKIFPVQTRLRNNSADEGCQLELLVHAPVLHAYFPSFALDSQADLFDNRATLSYVIGTDCNKSAVRPICRIFNYVFTQGSSTVQEGRVSNTEKVIGALLEECDVELDAHVVLDDGISLEEALTAQDDGCSVAVEIPVDTRSYEQHGCCYAVALPKIIYDGKASTGARIIDPLYALHSVCHLKKFQVNYVEHVQQGNEFLDSVMKGIKNSKISVAPEPTTLWHKLLLQQFRIFGSDPSKSVGLELYHPPDENFDIASLEQVFVQQRQPHFQVGAFLKRMQTYDNSVVLDDVKEARTYNETRDGPGVYITDDIICVRTPRQFKGDLKRIRRSTTQFLQ